VHYVPVRQRPPKRRRLFPVTRLFPLLTLILLFIFIVLALPGACFSAQVTIAWDGNAEPEVIGYRLHYGSASGTYSSYSDAGSQTACTLSGLEAGSIYFFAATAYDVYGNQSQYSTEITFTVPSVSQDRSTTLSLQAGWNLVSLPFQLANPSISAVLSPIAGSCTIVWAYRNGQWQWYAPQAPEGTLQAIDAGSAYWIKMSAPAQLAVNGSAGNRSTNLTAGWNFVGYTGSAPGAISTLLSSIAGKYSMVWAYEIERWRYYDPTDPDGSSLTQLQPGRGYWIKMREAAIWTLP
jgi:hypothetical protein